MQVASVLNLIITGIPSIHNLSAIRWMGAFGSFKPYYNWNTFNTYDNNCDYFQGGPQVLNLIITGIPSILISINLQVLQIRF